MKKSFDVFVIITVSLLVTVLGYIYVLEKEVKQQSIIYIHDTVYNQHSDWELLEIAIIWQETKGNPYPEYSDGESGGLYQITPIYVDEVNRILGYTKYLHEDRKDPIKSKEMFDALQNHHNPDKDIRKAIKLHNKGDKYYQEVMDNYYLLEYLNNK